METRCAADDSSPAAVVSVKSCQDSKLVAGRRADAAPPQSPASTCCLLRSASSLLTSQVRSNRHFWLSLICQTKLVKSNWQRQHHYYTLAIYQNRGFGGQRSRSADVLDKSDNRACDVVGKVAVKLESIEKFRKPRECSFSHRSPQKSLHHKLTS